MYVDSLATSVWNALILGRKRWVFYLLCLVDKVMIKL